MKKILRRFRIISIDVYIYQMLEYKPFTNVAVNYDIKEEVINSKKTLFFIKDSNKVVHKSYLFSNVFLLRAIKKNGFVIGDCVTAKSHRGMSIYPFVINRIAKQILNKKTKEIFIIVNRDNKSSIKGIEKAGFTKIASIKAKRWLWFYLKKEVLSFN